MIEISEYIKEKILEINPDLNTAQGSPFYELVVKSVANILEGLTDEVNKSQTNLNVAKVEEIEESQMDILASKFLVTRALGVKSTGYVIFYFTKQPTTGVIPVGTKLTSKTGFEYLTTASYSVSGEGLLYDVSKSLYKSGAVAIEAVEEGDLYNTLPDTIKNIFGVNISYLVSVSNPEQTTTGRAKQTNTEMLSNIKTALADEFYYNKDSFNRLKLLDNNIIKVEVVEAGQVEMLRDVINPLDAQIADPNFKNLNFATKVRNNITTNPNIGYTFSDLNDAVNIDPVTMTESSYNEIKNLLSLELSQEQYTAVGNVDTISPSVSSTVSILYPLEVAPSQVKDGWMSGAPDQTIIENTMQTAMYVDVNGYYKFGDKGI